MAPLDFDHKIRERLLRGVGLGGQVTKSGAGGDADRTARMTGPHKSDDHQEYRYTDKNERKSNFHCLPQERLPQKRDTLMRLALHKAKCCSRSTCTGASTMIGTRRTAGKRNSRKIANTLTPIGRMPHNNPCQAGGTASDLI